MKTLQLEVNVSADRRLTIELPEDFEVGRYQVVLVINPAEAHPQSLTPGQALSALAGKVNSFAGVDAIGYQRQLRDEWDASRLKD